MKWFLVTHWTAVPSWDLSQGEPDNPCFFQDGLVNVVVAVEPDADQGKLAALSSSLLIVSSGTLR